MKIDVSTKQNQVHPQSLDLGLSIRHEFIELKKPRSVNDTQLYKFKSGAVFFFGISCHLKESCTLTGSNTTQILQQLPYWHMFGNQI